jgi:hypothetical protein
MISSRFAVIGFSHADDAAHFTAHREHANPDPTFNRPVANEAVFSVIKPNIQKVKPMGVGKDLGSECKRDAVLFEIGRILVGVELELDLHV